MRQTRRHLNILISVLALVLATAANPTPAQSLLFDGDFESGTFQGWTPSGDNGGFASLAAKGTCYSGNDTTAISFNGDLGNNYAALLRSNAAGDPDSIAKLRSANFPAGRGILFSALSETSDAAPSDRPVELIVRILDSEGKVLNELPLNTAVVQLAVGCPSTRRDTAFAVHYIDTSQHNGEISIQFSQRTLTKGFGYFTLIDNVVLVEKGQVFVSQTQPIARAGTGLTSSNILFLDPRDSIDPDDSPAPLQFSWFINGEDSIRYFDMPCVNVNSDFVLDAGNHVATLYATDGFNYSADSIRFVVTSSQTTTVDDGDGDGNGDTDTFGGTLTTPEGDPIVEEANVVSSDGVTQTDPQQECDIDVADSIGDDEDGGEGTDPEAFTIDIDSSSEDTFDTFFTLGGDPVDVTSNNVDVDSSTDETVTQVVVTIDNPEGTDSLTVGSHSVSTLVVSNAGSSSITIAPDDAGSDVSDADYEIVLEAVEFEYTVGEGETAVTDQRSISYTATDSAGESASTSSTISIEE